MYIYVYKLKLISKCWTDPHRIILINCYGLVSQTALSLDCQIINTVPYWLLSGDLLHVVHTYIYCI